MIGASKYLNLDNSVLRVSALIIEKLLKEEVVTYNELRMNIHDEIGSDTQNLFIPSLNFLYCLGKLEYHDKLDSFSLRK